MELFTFSHPLLAMLIQSASIVAITVAVMMRVAAVRERRRYVTKSTHPKFGIAHLLLEESTGRTFIVLHMPNKTMNTRTKEPVYVYTDTMKEQILVTPQSEMEDGRFKSMEPDFRSISIDESHFDTHAR